MLQATLVLLLFGLSAAVEICGPTMTWKTANGKIMLNDHPFVLKGTSYYGFELETYAPTGLWSYDLNQMLDFVKANNFNALRIPFSMEMVRKNPSKPNVNCQTNAAICHLNSLDLMNVVIDRCAERGILVMLDAHRLSVEGGITELWYDNEYSEGEGLLLWDILLTRFASKWNLLALDIKNEPHWQVTWGTNKTETDFNSYAERFINHISKAHPQYKGLFFVEGIDMQVCNNHDEIFFFFAENLQGVHCKPVIPDNADVANRVVYSPHVYGPEEFPQPYFFADDFPKNMPAIWQSHFGFVPALTGHPVVISEWAWDQPGSIGEVWGHALATWLTQNCLTNQFWWAINPGKYGLLNEDYKTGVQIKLDFLQPLQPNPTKLVMRQPGPRITLSCLRIANCLSDLSDNCVGYLSSISSPQCTSAAAFQ